MSNGSELQRDDTEQLPQEDGGPQDSQGPPQGPAPTPFDHPLFLPVLLVGLSAWFGYDGWINQDPDMMEHRTFNQVGFAVLSVLAVWFGIKGYREWKEDHEQGSASGD
jgi:hypothetical protein